MRHLGTDGSPGNNESAGKKKRTNTVKGNPYIKSVLCEAAWSISCSRQTWLSAKFRLIN
ncbi:transposase [Tuberibacillus sp. Marseille-P3662]|uniref:transposase n=1 Tax=Tuberibacillus sp. Marseille-P3662 TaxID=1965358 RepID=UPI0034E872B0